MKFFSNSLIFHFLLKNNKKIKQNNSLTFINKNKNYNNTNT